MSDFTDNLFTIQAEKYLAGRLEALAELTDVHAFVLGAVTEAQVPMDLTPYCEIFVKTENDEKGMLARDESIYEGSLRFVVNLAHNIGIDWLDGSQVRTVSMGSHEQVAYFVKAARDELRRCVNSDMDNLTVDTEYVCEFKLRQGRYGLGFDQRSDSWFNVGEIDFYIRTQRTTEA